MNVKRADGGFARGQATEDFWQKPAGASSGHLAAGSGVLLKEKAAAAAAAAPGGALGLGRGGARAAARARGRGGLRRNGI